MFGYKGAKKTQPDSREQALFRNKTWKEASDPGEPIRVRKPASLQARGFLWGKEGGQVQE